MTRDLVLVSIDNGIGIIKLNRTAARNALSIGMTDALDETLARMDRDSDVKVVLLTSAGDHFAAGTDVKEMSALTMGEVLASNFSGCCDRLASMKKPVIAAVDGFALGGGCEIIEMCDIVIASERAKFGHPEVTVGTLSGCGGTQRLPRVIGKHWAMDVLLTGRPLSATEAYQCGLVSRVVSADRLQDEALGIARKIASLSSPVVQMIKSAVLEGLETPLPSALALERHMFHLTFALDDRAEGMAAFVEKRQPVFRDL